MTWRELEHPWSLPDVDAAELWAESGGQWLTDPSAGVPVTLVRMLAGLTEFLDDGGAGLVDLVGAGGVGVVGERAAALGLGRSDRVSCGGATRLIRAGERWLALSLARDDDVDLVPAWLESDAAIDRADAWPTIEHLVADRPAPELVERATLLGLACACVGEQTDARPVIASGRGDAAARPLGGLVVANLASLWAGPLAADVLARAGARVITVESVTRPDGARAAPVFFEALHANADSVALDLDDDAGRRWLRELLSRVDVVIEGSRPRALSQMGIDADELVRDGPRLWVSITAHGRRGDAARRIGYGDDGAAAGGLVAWIDGEPRFVADAIADPLAGLVTAATVAHLAGTGGRWLVDVALSRCAAAASTPFVMSPATPRAREPRTPQRRTDPGLPLPIGRDNRRVTLDLGLPILRSDTHRPV